MIAFWKESPWDFANTPPDHYPLLLFYHPLNIYRKQVIKQADVVLAMFLLGDLFSPEAKKRNFEFYDPLTTGNSSLSSCIEAIIATQIGNTDKAIQYGIAALLVDLADIGGNVRDGCHIASMGGTWMMLVYGLGGLRDHDGTLSFWPKRAPEDKAILRFSLSYRGQLLEVEIAKGRVEYTLRHGQALVIRHGTEQIELTSENAAATRAIPENWAASDRGTPNGYGIDLHSKRGPVTRLYADARSRLAESRSAVSKPSRNCP